MEKSGNFPQPVIRTIDELGIIADAGLEDMERYCRSYIHRGRSQGLSTLRWEEELCYIQREQEIRLTRELIHQQWVEEMGPDEDWLDDRCGTIESGLSLN